MATIGVKNVVGAKINAQSYGSLPTYDAGFMIGAAIEIGFSSTNNDNPLWADNRRVNEDKSFSDGTVSLNIDDFGDGTMADKVRIEAMLTGAKLVTDGGSTYLDYGETPAVNKIGCGWIRPGRLRDDTGNYYDAVWYYSVTFGGAPNETAQTKQQNITWSTPTVEGTINPVPGVAGDSNIRRKITFATEGEAIVWLNIMANIPSTEAQLNLANNNELFTLCTKHEITSVTVDAETVTIESAEDISTDAIREAVIAAILEAQEEPAP